MRGGGSRRLLFAQRSGSNRGRGTLFAGNRVAEAGADQGDEESRPSDTPRTAMKVWQTEKVSLES